MAGGKHNKARSIELIEFVARAIFGLISLVLVLLSVGLIVYSAFQLGAIMLDPEGSIGVGLLDAVGYTVIAIAVFDVGKYLLEEEAIRAREMRQASEARRSLTKFISTIAIAVFLEALVAVFEAGKDDVRLMLYPTLLLLAGVAIIVGLGVYQRLSASVENEVADDDDEPIADANTRKAAKPKPRKAG